MIRGVVTSDREARVRLEIAGPDGAPRRYVDMIIDTGFTGSVCLPGDLIRDLKLPRIGTRYAALADGSTTGCLLGYRPLA